MIINLLIYFIMFKRRTGFRGRVSPNARLYKRKSYSRNRRITGKRSRKFFKPTRMQLLSSAKLDKFVRSKVVAEKFHTFYEKHLDQTTENISVSLHALAQLTEFKSFISQFEEISLSSATTVVTIVDAKLSAGIEDTKAGVNNQIFRAKDALLGPSKRVIATTNPVKTKFVLKPLAVHKSARTSPWIRTRDLYLHGLTSETGFTLLPTTYLFVIEPILNASYYSVASTFTIVGRNHIASGTGMKAKVADRAIGIVQDGLVIDQHLVDKDLVYLRNSQLTKSGAGVYFSN